MIARVGHFIFLVLHAIAALFLGFWLLLVTIPLHLIFAAVAGRGGAAAPRPATHVKCPDCREFVLKEAAVCKHCGCRLVPQ